MSIHRRQKLALACFLLVVLSLVVGLVLYALRQNISLFYAPTELAHQTIAPDRMIRVGGMVVRKSMERQADGLTVQFKITDYQHDVTIHYRGVLPDLFREGQGVVVKGHLMRSGVVVASEVLAKHDEKYMPPEVKASLKQPPILARSDLSIPSHTLPKPPASSLGAAGKQKTRYVQEANG